MPHDRSRWRDKIRSVGLEFSAIRVSLDWLLTASVEDIHDVAEAGGNDDPHRGAAGTAYENLEATYFLRMFSMFEMAIKSYWRSLPGNATGEPDFKDVIDDVGYQLTISFDIIYDVQRIRRLRNDLVHEWNRAQVVTVDLPDEMNRLIRYFDSLPRTWA